MATDSPSRPRSRRGCRYFLNLGLVAALALMFAANCIIPAFIGYQLTKVRHQVTITPDTLLGFAYETVAFNTADDLTLSAWYIPSQNGAAIIAVHGSHGNRTDTVGHAAMLARSGYGVLMLDLRGHGNSGGPFFNLGWDSTPDIDAAVTYLQSRDDVNDDQIGALGLSMGGEVVLRAAATHSALRGVVSDGAGASTFDDFMQIPGLNKLGGMASIWSQYTAHRLATGLTPPPPMVDLIARIAPRPLLLISNQRGGWGERLLTDVYFAAAGEPKQRWSIPNATHLGGLIIDPDAYTLNVTQFFDTALLAEKADE